MSVQASVAIPESDDGVRPEDLFRRASFAWAVATRRLVDSSKTLTPNTRVAYAALRDIEDARDALDKLFMPVVSKVPAGVSDRANTLTTVAVQSSVADLAKRIVKNGVGSSGGLFTPHVVGTPGCIDAAIKEAHKPHRGADLSAPVHPKNGKMLWAGVDCPVCPSKATERCQKDEVFLEKPHPQRKSIVVG